MKLALRALLVLGTLPALAHPGWGIVVDPAGNVYYTDLKQVWRLPAAGGASVVVPHVHSHELFLDANGVLHGEHLWYDNATSTWGHYDWELVEGRLVREPAQSGLRVAGGLVRDAAGNAYWIEGSRLRKQAPDGAIVDVTTLPRHSDKAGEAPGGVLAVEPGGTAYVASAGDLLRVRPGSAPVRIASKLDEHVWTSFMTQPWHRIMALAPDGRGNVYVANSGARKVKKVSSDGRVEVVLTSSFPWAPTGIAVHPKGIYVLEYTDTGGSVRVRRIEPTGRVTVLR